MDVDVDEHRVLTHLLRRERLGIETLRVFVMELEGYPGHLIDLEKQGWITPGGPLIGLTPLGREIAESLPAQWQDPS